MIEGCSGFRWVGVVWFDCCEIPRPTRSFGCLYSGAKVGEVDEWLLIPIDPNAVGKDKSADGPEYCSLLE
jgi:hypothetical protein